MPSADLLALIADDTRQISYRPRWNAFTGSIAATILLQQVIYRWVHNGRAPFYKFNEPCQHPAYRAGDSWSEELGFTRRELETARSKIAVYTKGDLDKKAFISYWRDADRKTWYALNETAVIQELQKLYPTAEAASAGIQGRMDLPDGPIDLMAESANSNEEEPDLMAESANSNEEKPDLMAESADSQCTNPPIANGGKRHYQMAESAGSLNTKNTTKITTEKTTETTTSACSPNDTGQPVDVVVAVLSWLGFVGDVAKEPLKADTALAWAFWLQLNRARLDKQGKDPLAITIAAWRKANSHPPADCLRLARAWLAMNDDERRLTLATAGQPLFEIQAAMPKSLWPFDIPGGTLNRLHKAANGRFLPPALLPPALPSPEESDDPPPVHPLPPEPASAKTYKMPPETAALWKSTLGELELQMTKATFNTWLKDSKLRLNGGDTAVVYTRNAYAADWINGRLRETVSRTLSSIAGRHLAVEACEEAQD